MAGAAEITLKRILDDAGPYPLEAYEFLRSGLAHTVKMTKGATTQFGDLDDEDRHVSGQQLCLGLRDYATREYGLLAGAVLARWNVHRTDDFGKMVFALVDAGLMRKSDSDRLEDFQGVYDFTEAFPGPRSVGFIDPPVGPAPTTDN